MEVLRKRRASVEVQELMNAVKSDYDFFDSPSFQSAVAPTKRQRNLSDNVLIQYAVVRPKPRYNQGLNLSRASNEKYSDKRNRLNEVQEQPEDFHIPLEYQRRGLSQSREEDVLSRGQSRDGDISSNEQNEQSREFLEFSCEQNKQPRALSKYSREQNEYSREQNEQSCEQELMFHETTPDFWASHRDGKEVDVARPRRKSLHPRRTRIGSAPNSNDREPWPDMTDPAEYICLATQPIILRKYGNVYADGMVACRQKMGENLSSHKAKHLPLETVVEEQTPSSSRMPPLLIRVDANTNRGLSHNEEMKQMLSRSTKRNSSGFPISESMVHDMPSKIRRISMENEQETIEKLKSLEVKLSFAENSSEDSEEDELRIVESPTPVSRQLSDEHNSTNQKPENHNLTNENAQDNHVTSSQTNEKPEESTSKEVVPFENKSSNEGSIISLIPKNELWSDFVITRVGSLLWLDKEIVYPITLDEMRRRIQAPENFSFQMLIAYVRHSRAKGRQFLDYWKCQPSGKTCRPNVLSKLCEADAKELVKGIQRVNEEYFPRETLASKVAVNIFQGRGNQLTEGKGEDGPKDLIVEEKVKAIKKSRSVFNLLQKTLDNSQDDESFNTFNVASHNAGVENIKNSLQFLESIFERIQSHVQGNHKMNLPALTARMEQ